MARNHQDGRSNSVGNLIASRLKLSLFAAAVGIGSLLISSPAFASEPVSTPAITVLVFNFRQVPAKTLAKSEAEAERILEQAGVTVTWRDCPVGNIPCTKGPGRVFMLAIMAGPPQDKFMDTVSGFALFSDHIAIVYYDYLPRIPRSERSDNDTGLVLGCVITHELGHLLLGTRQHSVAGIMQAHWGVTEVQLALMSRLSFLPGETRWMHADAVAPKPNDTSSALISR